MTLDVPPSSQIPNVVLKADGINVREEKSEQCFLGSRPKHQKDDASMSIIEGDGYHSQDVGNKDLAQLVCEVPGHPAVSAGDAS